MPAHATLPPPGAAGPPSARPTIGERLLEILGARGWTISQLSRRCHNDPSVSQLSLLTRNKIIAPRISTLRAICAALEIDAGMLLGPDAMGRKTADLRGGDGTTTAPVVALTPDGGWATTGHAVAITAAQLAGRTRLFVTVIDGGGMAPYVMVGDRVLFDPDERARHGQCVVMRYGAATICAWRLERDGKPEYALEEGGHLDPLKVALAGVVVYIMRAPPAYRTRSREPSPDWRD